MAMSWDGRPLQIAEMRMDRPEEAEDAIRLLDRSEMEGERIRVFRVGEDILPPATH
jgi:hypothetical protein